MKVIFLDIDGVLNSRRTAVALGDFGRPSHLDRGECPLFDPIAVRLLQILTERSGAVIVWTSTWRIGKDPQLLADAFAKHYNWQGAKVIGSTPVRHGKRGDEIKEWLERNPVENYVILDDDSDMLPEQMSNFVKVPFATGLTFENILDAAEILGITPEDLMRRN